jgi:hypothetical protein
MIVMTGLVAFLLALNEAVGGELGRGVGGNFIGGSGPSKAGPSESSGGTGSQGAQAGKSVGTEKVRL